MVALRAREQTGRGQVVDTSLIEPLMTLLGPQLTAYDLLGELQPRTGNRSSHNAPRNVYRTADGSWVAVSASATSIAERVMRLVGRPDLAARAVVRDRLGPRRARRRDRRGRRRLDRASAPRDEVLAAFEAAGGRDRADLRRARRARRPAARGARLDRTVDDAAARALSDAERDQPPLRDARARSATRAAATAPTPRPCSRELGIDADELAGSAPTGRRVTVPPLTWLYVPADRPDRVEKAIASRPTP